MFAKDQIGDREIAVLNASLRVVAYHIESYGRHIREVEHKCGDWVNLIECPDKDEVVTKLFNKYNKARTENKDSPDDAKHFTFFDNADCSKWGPGHLMSVFYLHLSMRMVCPDASHRMMLMLKSFSNKCIKMPDKLYWAVVSEKGLRGGKSFEYELSKKLETLPSNIVNIKKQLLLDHFGMFQGILGCTSSVVGSDALRLSREISTRELSEYQLSMGLACTSDDYCRPFSFVYKKSSRLTIVYKSVSMVLRFLVSAVTQIGADHSILRNQEKSTISEVVMEFNSVFMESDGVYTPDVKMRVSYVDYGNSYEPFDNYMRCLRQAESYQKQEVSIVGAQWVLLCNLWLGLIQNQNASVLMKHGINATKIPLELGGIPSVSVVRSSFGHRFESIFPNYTPFRDVPNEAVAMAMIRDVSDSDTTDIAKEDVVLQDNPDVEEEHLRPLLKALKSSRKGVVRTMIGKSRDLRVMEEFMEGLPEHAYSSLQHKTGGRNIIASLMAVAQREISDEKMGSSKERLYKTTSPMRHINYYVSSPWLRKLLQRVGVENKCVSRDQLFQAGDEWLRVEGEVVDGELNFDGVLLPVSELNLLREQVQEDRAVLERQIASLRSIRRVVPVNRRPVVERWTKNYFQPAFVSANMQEFETKFMPVTFGGTSSLHPYVYLTTKVQVLSKLRQWSRREQDFIRSRVITSKSHSLIQSMCKHTFMEGSMLDCKVADFREYRLTPSDDRYYHLKELLVDAVDSSESAWQRTLTRQQGQGMPVKTKAKRSRASKADDWDGLLDEIINIETLSYDQMSRVAKGEFRSLDISALINEVLRPTSLANPEWIRSILINLCYLDSRARSKVHNSGRFTPLLMVTVADVRWQTGRLSAEASSSRIWNCSLNSESGEIRGVECVQKLPHGKYKHFVTGFGGHKFSQGDTSSDYYDCKSTSAPQLGCELRNVRGVVVLCLSGGHPLLGLPVYETEMTPELIITGTDHALKGAYGNRYQKRLLSNGDLADAIDLFQQPAPSMESTTLEPEIGEFAQFLLEMGSTEDDLDEGEESMFNDLMSMVGETAMGEKLDAVVGTSEEHDLEAHTDTSGIEIRYDDMKDDYDYSDWGAEPLDEDEWEDYEELPEPPMEPERPDPTLRMRMRHPIIVARTEYKREVPSKKKPGTTVKVMCRNVRMSLRLPSLGYDWKVTRLGLAHSDDLSLFDVLCDHIENRDDMADIDKAILLTYVAKLMNDHMDRHDDEKWWIRIKDRRLTARDNQLPQLRRCSNYVETLSEHEREDERR